MGNVLNYIQGKKYFLRADGSHTIGMGHIYRIMTLAKAIEAQAGKILLFCLEDEKSLNILNQSGLQVATFTPATYSTIIQKIIHNYQPQLIIQDILATTQKEIDELKQYSNAVLIHLDDTGAGLQLADVVINSIVFHWKKDTIQEVKASLFEGVQYMILQPSIEKYRNANKAVEPLADKIMLIFGGTDTHFLTERLLSILNQFTILTLNLHVVLGAGALISEKLHTCIQKSPHQIKFDQSVADLFKLIIENDLVICAGGNILYELACLGIPALAIAAEKHEIQNIEFWAEQGTCLNWGFEKELDEQKIICELHQIIYNKNQREAMAIKAKSLVDGQGLSRVLEIINNYSTP